MHNMHEAKWSRSKVDADNRRTGVSTFRAAISNASNERTSRLWARAALFEHAAAPRHARAAPVEHSAPPGLRSISRTWNNHTSHSQQRSQHFSTFCMILSFLRAVQQASMETRLADLLHLFGTCCNRLASAHRLHEGGLMISRGQCMSVNSALNCKETHQEQIADSQLITYCRNRRHSPVCVGAHHTVHM